MSAPPKFVYQKKEKGAEKQQPKNNNKGGSSSGGKAPPKPKPRSNRPSIAKWKERTASTHAKIMEFLKTEEGSKSKVLMLGSSMFERWTTTGTPFWKERNLDRFQVCNAGVGGDKTENVLWRVEQGLFNDFKPHLVILQIGTNNIEGDYPEDISDGISLIITKIKEQTPATKIVLCGVLPRNSGPELNEKLETLNALLATKQNEEQNVIFHDFGPFLLGEGKSVKTGMFADHVHLNAEGYKVWTGLLEELLIKYAPQ